MDIKIKEDKLIASLKFLEKRLGSTPKFKAIVSNPNYKKDIIKMANQAQDPLEARRTILRFEYILDMIRHAHRLDWENATIEDLPTTLQKAWMIKYKAILFEDPRLALGLLD